MTDSELQALVEQVSLADFGRPFVHKATFNRRLRTTGGRYVLQTHNLEINPLMIEEFDEQNLIGVIKHELVHYHNHIQGLPYQHKDRYFQTELQRIAGLRYAQRHPRPRCANNRSIIGFILVRMAMKFIGNGDLMNYAMPAENVVRQSASLVN